MALSLGMEMGPPNTLGDECGGPVPSSVLPLASEIDSLGNFVIALS